MLTLKTCARVVSESIEARVFELGIYIDDKSLYHEVNYQAHCYYYYIFYLFIHFYYYYYYYLFIHFSVFSR